MESTKPIITSNTSRVIVSSSSTSSLKLAQSVSSIDSLIETIQNNCSEFLAASKYQPTA